MAQTILITGVSHGLGRAMTEGFIQAGHTVIGCARSQDAIQQLQDQFGAPHDFAVVDVSDDQQVKAWSDRLFQHYPAPDLLINNAGVMHRLAPLWQIPAAEADQLIDVNLKGVINVIRHVVPVMIAREQGVIVNVSSGWGRSAAPEIAPYCASKWAIEGLTRSLAQELPARMAAIALNPGMVHTDTLEQCLGDAAFDYPSLSHWAWKAVPFLLHLSAHDNGQPVTLPTWGWGTVTPSHRAIVPCA